MTQLALELAIRAGESAMHACADRADRHAPGWADTALQALKDYAGTRAMTEVFTIEEARAVVEKQVEEPTDLRAWGKVTQMAVRRGVLVRTQHFAPAASSHGSPKPLYARGAAA